LISCSVAEICSVKFQSQSHRWFLHPSPWGVNARESSDQNFQIAVISEYVSTFGWVPNSDFRDYASKKKKKITTAVKYMPFGIVMPCGLITERITLHVFTTWCSAVEVTHVPRSNSQSMSNNPSVGEFVWPGAWLTEGQTDRRPSHNRAERYCGLS